MMGSVSQLNAAAARYRTQWFDIEQRRGLGSLLNSRRTKTEGQFVDDKSAR
ncbi:hypothetical protein Mapa_001786 [Marchantia paleacea]|nr:hypothetical protein Mapa_001786 [Marchantia paleacea]